MEMYPISSSETEAVYISCPAAWFALYLVASICVTHATKLPNSVPPLVIMSQFKYCFFLVVQYSTRGLLVLPSQWDEEPDADTYLLDYAVKFFHLVFLLVSCLAVIAIPDISPGVACIFIIPLPLFLYYQRCFRSHWMNLLRRVLNSSSINPFGIWLKIYMSNHGKINFSAATEQERNDSIFSRNGKNVETIKFAVVMITVTILFNYFGFNSFKEFLAVVYIAVAWLASSMLLLVTNDFRIFNFILDVMVGSTVAEAGILAHTWLAFAKALLLYLSRLELKSLPCRVHFVNIILIMMFYYVAYLVLFRQSNVGDLFLYNSVPT